MNVSAVTSNCPPHSFYESARFHRIVSYSLSLFTAPINFYGIYLILLKLDKTHKKAKWVMLNSQIWSVVVSLLLTTFIIPFLIVPVVGGHPLGLLTNLGIPASWQVFIAFGCIAQIGSTMVIVFENQQNHIVFNGIRLKSKVSRRIFAMLNQLVGFTIAIPILMRTPDQEIVKRNVAKWVVCPPPEFFEIPIFILAEDSSFISWVVSLILSLYIVEGVFCILHCTCHLVTRTRKLSSRTRALQRKFFINVCVQIFLPFSIVGGPISYLVFSISTGYHNQFLNNLAMILMSLHCSLSSIFMIMMHRNMRKEGILCCGKKNEVLSNYTST